MSKELTSRLRAVFWGFQKKLKKKLMVENYSVMILDYFRIVPLTEALRKMDRKRETIKTLLLLSRDCV